MSQTLSEYNEDQKERVMAKIQSSLRRIKTPRRIRRQLPRLHAHF